MGKALSQSCGIVLLVAASSCFSTPIGPPSGLPLDAALVGEWQCEPADPASGGRATLEILRFDDQQYYAEWKEKENEERLRYRAYPVRLAGVTVLSVGDLAESRWPWTAVRYAFPKEGELVLDLPAERILDISDEKAAILELTTKADRPDTWQRFARCGRSQTGV